MKKFVFVIVSFIFIFNSYGQIEMNDDYWKVLFTTPSEFNNVMDSFDVYLERNYPDSIPSDKIAGVKDYYRFINFWQPRLGVIDSNFSYQPYLESVLDTLYPICGGNDSANWEILGPVELPTQYLGLVSEVLNDPENSDSYLLSSENGGLWKRYQQSSIWENVTEYLRIPGLSATEMIRNPFDNEHIIVSTGCGIEANYANYGMGIIESFDNGETWSIMDGFPHDNYPLVRRVIADPNDNNPNDGLTLYAITQRKIFYSTNTGQNWTELTSPVIYTFSHYTDIEIDNQGSVYVSTRYPYNAVSGQIFKYISNNWVDLSSQFGQFGSARIAKPYGGKIYILIDYPSKRSVYQTVNYGTNWTIFKGTLAKSPKDEIEYSPNSNIIYIGDISLFCYKGSDTTRFKVFGTGHADVRDIVPINIENGSEVVLIANDGGISKLTLDTSLTQPQVLVNLNGNYLPIGEFLGIGIAHATEEFVVGGAMHCNSFRYEDNDWIKFSGGDGGDCEVNWDDPSIYYWQDNNLMKSTHGTIYSTVANWFIGMEYELNPNNPYKVYFGRASTTSINAKLFIYDELTHSLTSTLMPNSLHKAGAIGINTNGDFYVADFSNDGASVPNRFVKSTDGGNNWSDLSSNSVYEFINGNWVYKSTLGQLIAWKTIRDIVFDPIDPDNIWISIGGIYTESGLPVSEKFRVLYSDNAGSSWKDFSENLPALPVNTMEYQSGSPQRIFAGTDVGVFYRDSTMSQWECFSNGLPISIITDLDYDPCNNVLYASTYSWSIFKTSLNFLDNNDMILPTGSFVWDTPRELNYNLIIPNNCTLEINSNIHVAPNKKIIVQRGGNLILDGGRLFNNCGNMWQGVEVWGTTQSSQSTSGAQGKITIENGGTIENAVIAVFLSKSNGSGGYTAGYEGGIIQTIDGHFINNRTGVRFFPYRNLVSGVEMDNLSYFHLSEFLTDSELADESIPENFIHLDGVKGINVKGCTFSNTRSEEEASMSNRGIGIFSYDANFTVSWYSGEDPDSSKFINLNYGIKAIDATTTRAFEVNRSGFYNNLTGIYFNNIDQADIIFNDFELYNVSLFHGPDDIFGGVYIDESTLYTIEENNFFNDDEYDPQNEIRSIGITANNTGNDLNLIYRNTFDRLHMGILAQNGNRGTGTTTGLKLKCNTCTNNEGDFAVTAETSSASMGISIYQGAYIPGSKTAQAGNLFTHADNNDPYSDFNNTLSRQWIYYFHHNGTSNNPWVPVYYQNITNYGYGTYYVFDTACPTNFSLGLKNSSTITMGEDELKSRMIMMENLRDSATNDLSLWIDAGDTPELNYEVESSTPDESMTVYDELIANSPYISDTVLSTSIEKEDVLVNAMIRDIMVANPHGAKKEELIEALEQRVPSVPEYMMAEIMAGLDSIAQKEQRESEIAWYAQERDLAFNKLMKIYLEEVPLASAEDSLTSLILNYGNLNSQYFLAIRYLEHGDASNAFSLLSDVPNKFAMDSEQQSEHQDYLTVLTLINNTLQQGMPLESLDSTSRQVLYQIADNDSRPAVIAQNILQYIDTASYPEVYILPTSGPVIRRYEAKNPDIIPGLLDQGNIFKVYPNPSHDYFIIDYYFEIIPKDASYSISDPLGRVIEEGIIEGQQDQIIFRTSAYSSGLYTIKLITNGKAGNIVKLNIIK